MSITQIIENEIEHVRTRRLRACAQGRWQKAADSDVAEEALLALKKRVVENEAKEAKP